MYNGFDWYGRTLEVREVCDIARSSSASTHDVVHRIVTLDYQVLDPTVVASVVDYVVVGSVVAVFEEVFEADSEVDLPQQAQAETSPAKTSTLIIPALTNPLQVVRCAWTGTVVPHTVLLDTQVTMPSRASKSWSAT